MTHPAPLRIAHVQPMSLDLFGHDDRDLGTGVRYSVWNLAAAQARAGDQPTVHLLASKESFQLQLENVTTKFCHSIDLPSRVPFRYRFARQFSPRMLRLLQRADFDLVHFHGVDQFHGMYLLTALRCTRQQLCLFGQDRGYREVGRLERAARDAALRRTAAVIAHSPASVSRYVEAGVPEGRVSFVPNGYDPLTFHARGRRTFADDTPTRVLWVARLVESKAPMAMAEGVAMFVKEGGRAEVTIISEGPLRSPLEEHLRREQIHHRFVGHVSQEDLGGYYRDADVLVLPQHGIGSNQVVIEALACGLPVIASDLSGIREAVGSAGILIRPADASDIAAALRSMSDAATWRSFSARAVDQSGSHTWDAVAATMRILYLKHRLDRSASSPDDRRLPPNAT